jgi:hypothetical protein
MFYKTPLQADEIPEDRANRIEVRNLRSRNAAIGEPWMFGDTVLAINVINSMDWHNPEVKHETTRHLSTAMRRPTAGLSPLNEGGLFRK